MELGSAPLWMDTCCQLTQSPPDLLHLRVPPARFLVFLLEMLDYTNSRIAAHSHFGSWGAGVVKGVTAGGARSGL